MTRATERPCECGSKQYPSEHYDGYGIFLFYACDKCYKGKIAKYRPDIMERYDTDEQIEDDY